MSGSRHEGLPDSVGAIGERGLIEAVTALLSGGPDVLLGPGDDAALVRVGGGADGREVLVSTDMAVEGRHFRRDWSTAEDVGHRIAAANLSDVAAMGGTATTVVVAIAAPGDLPTRWALDLTQGMLAESQLVGASIVGGDVVESDRLTVAVTVLGACAGPVVGRGGAEPGDVVAVAGRLGWAAAGLAVLSRGFRSPRAVVDAHRRPEPPYAQGPVAAGAGATAMIDVSDGLLADLGHLAAAGSVGIDLTSSSLEVAEPLLAVGAALGVDPLELVLRGGDDHALAATFPPGADLPAGWRQVGQVAGGEGVTVDGAAPGGALGHRHY
jgi:thiamine-monophosphate kinase